MDRGELDNSNSLFFMFDKNKEVGKIKKTKLNQVHADLGAKLIDFGGWHMPVQYTGILDEHKAVRQECGLFDVSHMGEIVIEGDNALEMVQKLITNDATRLVDGQILYSPMCYADGGIVDDLLVYQINANKYLLVVNAANTDKDWKWIQDNAIENVKMENVSDDYAQIALQGPKSKELMAEITDIDLDSIKYYWFTFGEVGGAEALLSRTGYTGELGYEIYVAPDKVVGIWNKLMEKGENYGLKPVGLGARDTLRLEKNMCLYGNDISKDTHPLEAGLSWTVDFEKDDFNGKDALLKIKEDGYDRKLVGFKVVGRGIPRHGYEIEAEGNIIGEVTSGSFSPTLEENIGLGYVKKGFSKPGQTINIKVRKRDVKAQVIETPFV